jgi:hypothetical protein
MLTKAGVGAGMTSVTGWATEMAPYDIGREFFLLLQSASIFGRLSAAFRRLPFHVKQARETGAGGTGAWRGEGLPAPITKSTTDTLTQDYFESDYIVIVTRELFKFGAVAEATLRQTVIAGLARWIDGQLLDPTVTKTAAHPASITNGTPTISSAGSTAANAITDLSALIAAIQSSGDALYFVTHPLLLAALNGKLASVGYPTVPGFLLGLPVIAGSTAPRHQIALVDAANIAFSSDDTMAIDVATDASVEMSNTPTQSGASGGGAAMVSLFQSGLVGVRAGLGVNWQPIHFNGGSPTVPSGVATVTVTY